ncbi:BolA/IbaG family iron-sulfur metabolism protein [Methylocystis sp. WRRC1]|uniref:BolA family protein n=1 Tax=unclassified Methylocystis TaxID=2625913 RepID=UPI0001F87563|nr:MULTISPECIES: BolA/IbaG family iron-sulfur metabolism protein [unclassified Methylocystis]MCC3245743.1 BolA/IbaG family iron-sulfur metabolism protein [Methylocystis sp. WRRC1]
MPMPAAEIERLIKQALPDATVELTALADDNDHWAATVVSESFRGLSRVKQHQLVNAAFGARLGTELHALALTTRTP